MKKEQCIEKLIELGVYEQFVENLKNNGQDIGTYEDDESFWDYIAGAFIWKDSPEGQEFWYNIAEKQTNIWKQ